MTRQTGTPITHQSLQSFNRSAREIARMTEYGLELAPSYQRGSVWTEEQRINLVRSWLAGVPIPAVTINDRLASGMSGINDPAYAVIDGKQRIETAIAWFAGELAVPASWFEEDSIAETVATDDGDYVTYNGLTVVAQRHFSNRAQLPTIEVRVKSLEEEAALYVLLEQSGTKQTANDVAKAEAIARGR